MKKDKDPKLPPPPEAPEFDLWKGKVYHMIATAAQHGYIIHPWIVKIEKPEVSFDDLSDTEGYDTLEAALCCAIFEVAKGELSGTLTLKSRELRSQGHLLTGRQAFFTVHAEFAIDDEHGALYDLSDLMLLRFKSDDQAPRILNLCQHTVQGVLEKQPGSNLMTLLKAQLENSPALKLDMAHFNRLPQGDLERTTTIPHDLPHMLRGHRQEEAERGRVALQAAWRTAASYCPGRPLRGGARH